MFKRRGWLVLFLLIACFICNKAYGQQDVNFNLTAHLLPGKKILKVKRDFNDDYLWVLAQNNQVYRINSLTQAIDDYTSTFSSYNNLQFVDIAGRSQDTVFIGTNSSSVLEYQKGAIKDISQAVSIAGTVNQIGMDYQLQIEYDLGNPLAGHKVLVIGTTGGLYFYNDDAQTINTADRSNNGNNQIFEASYRNLVYTDLYHGGYQDGLGLADPYPVIFQSAFTQFWDLIWYNNADFGYSMNAAYNIKSVYNDPSDATGGYYESGFMNELWGTETGLWQQNAAQLAYHTSTAKQYLAGIKVNKITSIYGLVHFPTLLKENVLVGTDNGLYFTNSAYEKYAAGNLNEYNTFMLDNDIGNQHINDISVNPESYLISAFQPPVCENAVWVAADDGLYLITPDYAPYVSTAALKAIVFDGQPANQSTLNVCGGSSATAIINTDVYNGDVIQWYKDGAVIPGEVAGTLTITQPGVYSAVIYDPCSGFHRATNKLTVTYSPGPTFGLVYPPVIQQCNNTPLTLTATGGPENSYRWYKDGVLNGNTTLIQLVTQSGNYYMEASLCPGSWVASRHVEVDMINLPQPNITSDKTTYCQSDVALLSANIAADPSYTIEWYKDNVLLPADENLTSVSTTAAGTYTVTVNSNISTCNNSSAGFGLSFTAPPVLTFNYPAELDICSGGSTTLSIANNPAYQYRWYKDGVLNGATTNTFPVSQTGKYKVEVSACPNSWVSSAEVLVNFIQLPVPAITPDKPAYCIGDNATLSIATPLSPNYTINWYRDNVLLPANTNQLTLLTNVAGNYSASVVNNTANADGTICSQPSAPVQLSFDAYPTISITQIANTSLCTGQTVTLKVNHNIGSVIWSTGETTDQINVTTTGDYSVTVAIPSGCQTSTDATVAFLPLPVFNVKDTTVCTYKNQTTILTAPDGFSQYSWNGQTGTQTYAVTLPQTVTLMVTDANGCQASQQIHVVEQCPDVEIPNTFTPNGDGINDTWDVQGLDKTATVKIFNRYGTLLYQSKGYVTPWKGTYNGSKLPSGVYYYIITVKNGTQTYSGSITIIY